MYPSKRIALIIPDVLRSIGLKCLIEEFFPDHEAISFQDFRSFMGYAGREGFDYYITDPEIHVRNADFFFPRRGKVALLIHSADEVSSNASFCYLPMFSSKEVIVEQLQGLLMGEPSGAGGVMAAETNKDLSLREVDVLRQVVKGITNKEIADRLNISLNTVLSHRKNITAKLGIKTISGLTFYAIMNAIVSGDEIEAR